MAPGGIAALAVGGTLVLTATAGAAQLHSLTEVRRALNACWVPPPREQMHEGMQITVRFSMTRDGAILGEPRFTFTTPDVLVPIRAAYQRAVAAAFARCMPLSFSPTLAESIAGRPIAWRITEKRKHRRA